MDSIAEESRKRLTPNGKLTPELINLGCQQRIADAAERTAAASELMASNFLQLQQEVAKYKKWYEQECATTKGLRLTITNLKGQVTKAKRKGGQDA